MISAEDLAAARANYDDLLASEVASTGAIQSPNRSKDDTGAANVEDWVTQSTVPVIVEELQFRQLEGFKLRNDNEVKESAYVLIMKHDVEVQVGDRIVIVGDSVPYQVMSVPPARTLDIVTEAICVQSIRLSDRV